MNELEQGTLQSLFDRGAPALGRQLADTAAMWQDARSRHIPALFGCSCGTPMAHVSASDFELDLIDFVFAKHAATSEAGRFLLSLERRDIEALISALASLDPAPDFASVIAADLSRSIRSFSGRRNTTSGR